MAQKDEIVYVIDPNWSDEEKKKVELENRKAKLLHAERREEELIAKAMDRDEKFRAAVQKLRNIVNQIAKKFSKQK